MSTLSSERVRSLLDRLHQDAASTDGALRARLAGWSPEERTAFFARAQTDYRGFYGLAKDLYLPVSRETGKLLYLLGRSRGARNVVEFGTSFGLSTVYLAAALRDNGGGRLIGSEFEPEKASRARLHLAEAGLSEGVEIREGDALESLAGDLPETIDLVLLDGAKVLYPRILALLQPRFVPGTLVVADNADDSPAYLEQVRASAAYVSVPFSTEVEVSVFTGLP